MWRKNGYLAENLFKKLNFRVHGVRFFQACLIHPPQVILALSNHPPYYSSPLPATLPTSLQPSPSYPPHTPPSPLPATLPTPLLALSQLSSLNPSQLSPSYPPHTPPSPLLATFSPLQPEVQGGVAVVDVYSGWAGPCLIMKPIIFRSKAKVGRAKLGWIQCREQIVLAV